MSTAQSKNKTSFRGVRTVVALMLREISSTYGRSNAGYLWALAEPVGGIAFLSIVFSLALRSPSLGDSFGLYYATGFLPFALFNEVSQKTANAMKFSKPLLGYPRVTYIDTIVARALLNSLTSIIIGVLLVSALVLFNPSFVFLNLPEMALAYLMTVSLALGIGTLNCFLFWKFTAWNQIWSILTRPLFLISGIFFNFEDLPKAGQDILWYNPLVHVIGQMRMGVYATYEPAYISYQFVFAIAIGALSIGLILLYRYHQEVMYS